MLLSNFRKKPHHTSLDFIRLDFPSHISPKHRWFPLLAQLQTKLQSEPSLCTGRENTWLVVRILTLDARSDRREGKA